MYYNVRLPKLAWWRETNQTDKLEHSYAGESDDLTLKHISGAFYALAGCLLISTGVFIQELVTYYWKRIKVRPYNNREIRAQNEIECMNDV